MSVKVYTTKTCPWCYKVKEYLRDNNIKFTEADVSQDTEAAMEMIQKSSQRGVPVTDINGNIIIGFDQERIDSLLGL